MKVKLIFHSKLLKFFRKDIYAFTIGKRIFIRKDQISVKELAHELVHVEQYQRYGIVHFLLKYFLQSLTHSYMKIPLEVEAYKKQTDEKFLKEARILLGLKS